jgi:phenylalanyl-tRNA synthetase beta chain
MHISLSWLAEFIDLDLPLPELEQVLTSTGLSVEHVEQKGLDSPHVVVAQIQESVPHPDADRLSVCQVDDGSGQPRQIVCGAKNYQVGDKVPLALPGAVLPGDFRIKSGKLRGVKSEGMMCSGREIGLGDDANGLLILPPDAPVGQPLSTLFPPTTVLELEITPNRPDWLSHYGVARELGAFLQKPVRQPSFVPSTTEHDPSVAILDAASSCLFYSVRRIQGVRVAPSPEWLRRRLEEIGLRPINNVVDVTNYVLHEMGQPLHAFDAAQIQGGIVIRAAHDGESFSALDEQTYTLAPEDTVISDTSGQALALGGVMGGASSGVTESTTDVLLESAFFVPQAIRRTSRRLGLSSDSSYRFERGVDPQRILAASARATELIIQLAGGEPDSTTYLVGELPAPLAEIPLRHDRCRDILGLPDLSDAEICACLPRLGLEQISLSQDAATTSFWKIPSYRADLTREVDLIEEVIRLLGLNRIPQRLAGFPSPVSSTDLDYDATTQLRQKLTQQGFSEARLSTLVSPQQIGSDPARALRLKNPLGEDQSYLRPSLLPGLWQALSTNLRHGQSSVRLFEIGLIYAPTEPEEQPALGLVACGPRSPLSWGQSSSGEYAFFDLRGLLDALLGDGVQMEKVDPPTQPWIVQTRVLWRGQDIGTAGILHPRVAADLDADAEILSAELHLAPILPHLSSPSLRYEAIPRYPSTRRDIALILPETTPFSTLDTALQTAGEPLLQSWQPFDVFRDPSGEKLPIGQKSIAVSLTFQSPERTLESSEIETVTLRLKTLLREQIGAEFRE